MFMVKPRDLSSVYYPGVELPVTVPLSAGESQVKIEIYCLLLLCVSCTEMLKYTLGDTIQKGEKHRAGRVCKLELTHPAPAGQQQIAYCVNGRILWNIYLSKDKLHLFMLQKITLTV